MAPNDSCKVTRQVLKFWILWILSFLPLMFAIKSNVWEMNFEIKKLLKTLNKPHVKSIKSPDGDIIDCVLINLQPAFDNPLLKNHTIQMKPSSYPKGFSRKYFSKARPATQLWQTKGSCPKGTIPIRRTRKNDILLRVKFIQSYAKKRHQTISSLNSHPINQTNNVHEYAIRSTRQGAFHGARAGITIWNPRVMEPTELSVAQIWVINGTTNVDLNTIEAGWQVCYNLYGDYRTRLFGFFTNDGYRTHCYNLECSGFVQIHEKLVLGGAFGTVSTYDGEQYQITLIIFKDTRTGHWWLQNQDQLIGYWPVSLFTHLRDSARQVDWGGEVVNNIRDGRHTTTEMGSGRFPTEGYKKAASFIGLQVVDQSNQLITPNNFESTITKAPCYNLISTKNDGWGEYFYYGGPGRNPTCN